MSAFVILAAVAAAVTIATMVKGGEASKIVGPVASIVMGVMIGGEILFNQPDLPSTAAGGVILFCAGSIIFGVWSLDSWGSGSVHSNMSSSS